MVARLKKQRKALIICLVMSMILHIAYGIEGMKQMEALENEVFLLEMENSSLERRNALYEQIIENQEQDASEVIDEPEYIGTFTVTHYCLENYPHICNDGESKVTASGEAPIPYYTVAADESLEFGTKLIIDGQEYEVMDRGGAIKNQRIDIAVKTHSEALEKGIIQAEVYIGG